MKCFVVEEPKPREIFAADFRDRIVHHLVVAVMEPIWERKFIDSRFACRKGKGIHGTLGHLRKRVREISRGGRSPVWVLQLDLARFFVSIHRPTLCALMGEHAPTAEMKALIHKIYLNDGRVGARISNATRHIQIIPHSKSWFSQKPEFGLPIGNLTSQFGANVYLNGLDHFIQRQLKPLAYLRYMDDLILLDRNIEKLKTYEEPVNEWLQRHRLQELNPAKSKLVRMDNGIMYLGFHAAQMKSRREPLQFFPTGKKKWKFIQGLRHLQKSKNTPPSIKTHPLAPWLTNPEHRHRLASINSRFGSLVHSKSYRFRERTVARFEKEIQGEETSESYSYSPYEIKEGYRAIRLR